MMLLASGNWCPSPSPINSASGYMWGVHVRLWDPFRTRAIPENLRGVIMTRCYTNPHSPLPYVAFTDLALDIDLACVHVDAFCHSRMPLLSVEGHFTHLNRCCFSNWKIYALCSRDALPNSDALFIFIDWRQWSNELTIWVKNCQQSVRLIHTYIQRIKIW